MNGERILNIIGIIPARMESTRFPGKPLAKILDVPMLGHCYFRCKLARTLSEVYVATCDEKIAEYVKSIGGKAVMTAKSHDRATDRVAEAMLKIEAETGIKTDILVMIQGDEPMTCPEMIDEAVGPMLEDSSISVVNLMSPMSSVEEFEDPNEVKVVVDLNNKALYFSREPIPSRKKGVFDVPMMKQVCIIPFTREFLLMFNNLKPTPLEVIESVDMMRVLEHGYEVVMVRTEFNTYSVDTEDDLRRVQELMKGDKLMLEYPKNRPFPAKPTLKDMFDE